MSDIAIRARDLRKIYRLYTKPHYRFLDMFGMLGNRPGAFTEHPALDGVSLDIRRGEKVAVIGRNGAGKSTFLKLVTNVIQPTSGELTVAGKVHALLQIGTGFHPDFTGRQNVYAYLAQLGVSGKEAERKCAEIIDFAELESYIDQPVKTYSSGMGVRLMFSTSTAITPDLLVLDEVLGVGDAYFAHKSYDRIKELCEGSGTTLLLVTHDVYSASRLCPRAIWIDRGCVLMDADAATVVKAYEDSIRQQEEQRFRARKQDRVRELMAATQNTISTVVIVELRARDNRPQPSPVYFSRIELTTGSTTHRLPLGAGAFDELLPAHLQREGTNWGEPGIVQGREARPLQNFGSSFHKVAGVVTVPAPSAAVTAGPVALEVEYWSAEAVEMVAAVHVGGRTLDLGPLPSAPGEWVAHRFEVPSFDAGPAEGPSQVNVTGQYGSGAISVTDVRAFDGAGRESFSFTHRQAFELRVGYRINRPGLRERAQVLVQFHRNGVEDVCRIITRDLLFEHAVADSGVVTLRLPRLPLANGTYTVTVMVAEEGYYDRQQTVFFSINPGVYNCLTKIFEIAVRDGGIVGSGTATVVDGEWSLVATQA